MGSIITISPRDNEISTVKAQDTKTSSFSYDSSSAVIRTVLDGRDQCGGIILKNHSEYS
jgi:hypothetical protein